MPIKKIRLLTTLAMLIAISVVLSRILAIIYTGDLRMSLGNIPIMLAGMFFGPIAGGVCGFLADLIGCLLRGDAYFLPLALSPVLVGALPGLLYMLFTEKIKFSMGNLLLIGGTVVVTNITTSLLWTTFALSLLWGKGFFVMLPGRFLETAIQTILEIIILAILLNNRDVRHIFGKPIHKQGDK